MHGVATLTKAAHEWSLPSNLGVCRIPPELPCPWASLAPPQAQIRHGVSRHGHRRRGGCRHAARPLPGAVRRLCRHHHLHEPAARLPAPQIRPLHPAAHVRRGKRGLGVGEGSLGPLGAAQGSVGRGDASASSPKPVLAGFGATNTLRGRRCRWGGPPGIGWTACKAAVVHHHCLVCTVRSSSTWCCILIMLPAQVHGPALLPRRLACRGHVRPLAAAAAVHCAAPTLLFAALPLPLPLPLLFTAAPPGQGACCGCGLLCG